MTGSGRDPADESAGRRTGSGDTEGERAHAAPGRSESGDRETAAEGADGQNTTAETEDGPTEADDPDTESEDEAHAEDEADDSDTESEDEAHAEDEADDSDIESEDEAHADAGDDDEDGTPELVGRTPPRPSTRQRYVTWLLLVAVLVAGAGVVYVGLTPGLDTDPYTEFYVLGPGGEAGDYPINLTVGETGTLTVGLTNNEHQRMTYTVVVTLDGDIVSEETIRVADGATWEEERTFETTTAGESMLVLELYTGDETEGQPYRDLELPIIVRSDDATESSESG